MWHRRKSQQKAVLRWNSNVLNSTGDLWEHFVGNRVCVDQHQSQSTALMGTIHYLADKNDPLTSAHSGVFWNFSTSYCQQQIRFNNAVMNQWKNQWNASTGITQTVQTYKHNWHGPFLKTCQQNLPPKWMSLCVVRCFLCDGNSGGAVSKHGPR